MRALRGLLLALCVLLTTSVAAAPPGPTSRVAVTLEACPAIELVVQAQPLAPVIDPSPETYQQRIFVCPKE